MKIKIQIQGFVRVLSLLSVTALATACGEEATESTKYPGELGAACESKSDCDDGAICTRDFTDDENFLAYCTRKCSTDAECGEQGACVTSTIKGLEKTCSRRCDSADFCEDLSKEYNACQAWPESHDIKVCGFRG